MNSYLGQLMQHSDVRIAPSATPPPIPPRDAAPRPFGPSRSDVGPEQPGADIVEQDSYVEEVPPHPTGMPSSPAEVHPLDSTPIDAAPIPSVPSSHSHGVASPLPNRRAPDLDLTTIQPTLPQHHVPLVHPAGSPAAEPADPRPRGPHFTGDPAAFPDFMVHPEDPTSAARPAKAGEPASPSNDDVLREVLSWITAGQPEVVQAPAMALPGVTSPAGEPASVPPLPSPANAAYPQVGAGADNLSATRDRSAGPVAGPPAIESSDFAPRPPSVASPLRTSLPARSPGESIPTSSQPLEPWAVHIGSIHLTFETPPAKPPPRLPERRAAASPTTGRTMGSAGEPSRLRRYYLRFH